MPTLQLLAAIVGVIVTIYYGLSTDQTEVVLSAQFNVPRTKIFNHLISPASRKSHILIERVEDHSAWREGNDCCSNYTIHELVPILGGIVKLPNPALVVHKYHCQPTIDESEIRHDITTRPNLKIHQKFHLKEKVAGGGKVSTTLVETVVISGPRILIHWVAGTLHKAHTDMFERLNLLFKS